jgi:hypothetical protein
MNKSIVFTGQPIFTQLLKFIPRDKVQRLAGQLNTDRYYKRFKTYEHLVTMLYTCFHGCKSLREVTTGMQVCFGKLNHLSMRCIPRRSTLSDANRSRGEEFFGRLYHELYRFYYGNSPDSRKSKNLDNRLFIIDSTTVSLFSDVMRGTGGKPLTGKQKGGAKAHVLLKASEDVPRFVCITDATSNDRIITGKFTLEPNSILVFDKGYISYAQMEKWNTEKITWVSRVVERASFKIQNVRGVSKNAAAGGVLSDQHVIMGRKRRRGTVELPARKITFLDDPTGRTFEFMTNNMTLSPLTIASLYKKRWQIELLFKRIKQHYPLRYFLGDNENAIKIQIWCALITDLLVKIVKDRLKRKWSYANIASMIRLHLMSYINLFQFLNNPDRSLQPLYAANDGQLSFQT